MYKFLILLILLVLGFCKQDDSLQTNCPEQIICTEEFRTITLTVTDSNNSPVALDYYYSFNKTNGQIYKLESNPSLGVYTVLSDSEMRDILQNGSVIVFSGTLNGEKINEEFVIGHNCCHVVKVSGESEIVVSLEE